MTSPQTLLEAIQTFADLDVATEFFAKMRWPEGPSCPRCECREYSHLAKRRLWQCKACRYQYSVKKGSIFEDSAIPLTKWLPAVWLIANCKNGISSHELARSLGVCQKTAWFMLHRIRLAMRTGSFEKYADKFDGAVEVDETYIGGKARNMNAARRRRWEAEGGSKGHKGKTGVIGFRERGGRVVVTVLNEGTGKQTLQREVRKRVKPGAAVITDELQSYRGLDQSYQHLVINHAEKYVDGQVHTNGLENFWSLLKRGLGGTYVSVRPYHLARYLDEQVFRYNEREGADAERFAGVLNGAEGKRVTWKELTGKERRDPKPASPPKRRPKAYPLGPF
jgi:transposase-like protein